MLENYINKIINADCMDILKQLPDKCIDAIICDLPYGTTACSWDSIIPFDKLWEQYKRIRKDNTPIVLFGSEPFSTYLRMSNIKEYKYDWIWEKSRPSGINFKSRPMKKHEIISVFCKNKIKVFNAILENKEANGKISHRKPWITWNTGKSEHLKGKTDKKICNSKRKPTSILKFSSVSNFPKNLHPTQKPVALLEYLVKTYSNEGDLILDNCSGSGTTAVACHNLKRRFICIERDIDYYKASVERLKIAQSQLKLF